MAIETTEEPAQGSCECNFSLAAFTQRNGSGCRCPVKECPYYGSTTSIFCSLHARRMTPSERVHWTCTWLLTKERLTREMKAKGEAAMRKVRERKPVYPLAPLKSRQLLLLLINLTIDQFQPLMRNGHHYLLAIMAEILERVPDDCPHVL